MRINLELTKYLLRRVLWVNVVAVLAAGALSVKANIFDSGGDQSILWLVAVFAGILIFFRLKRFQPYVFSRFSRDEIWWSKQVAVLISAVIIGGALTLIQKSGIDRSIVEIIGLPKSLLTLNNLPRNGFVMITIPMILVGGLTAFANERLQHSKRDEIGYVIFYIIMLLTTLNGCEFLSRSYFYSKHTILFIVTVVFVAVGWGLSYFLHRESEIKPVSYFVMTRKHILIILTLLILFVVFFMGFFVSSKVEVSFGNSALIKAQKAHTIKIQETQPEKDIVESPEEK